MKQKKYVIKYAMLQVFYWAVLCAIMGYAVVYMLNKGYSNSEIGMVMAVSNIVAVVLQPFIASMTDKYEKLTLRKNIAFLAMGILVMAVILLFLERISVVMTICMSIAMIATTVMQPFLNAVAVKLQEQGIQMNFGLCRACGSVAYAVVSTIVGVLIEKYSVIVVPVAVLILLVFFFACLYSIGNVESVEGSTRKESREDTGKTQGLFEMLTKNKRFALFLCGVVLVFYTHTITSNYLIQIVENVGGRSSHMGIASSIAAIVELPAMIFFVKLVRKIKCQTLLRIAGFFFAIKYVALYLAESVSMVYAAQAFQAVSYAIYIPASVHYVTLLFGKADTVKAQSFITTAITLGNVFASLIGGRLLDVYGTKEMLFIAVIVAIVGVVLMTAGVESREKKVIGIE